jgi:serine/threonine protein kinase
MICPSLKAADETEELTQQNIIGVGQFATVHKINNTTVRKIPSDKSYTYSVEAVEIEAKVYKHLGKHKRIAKCIRCSNEYIDLRYEPNGNLEAYLADNPLSVQWRYRLARQALEAVIYIHKMNVVHSDLSARQFLVDEYRNIRLSDFGGSALNGSSAIVMENATHFPSPG